MNQVNLKIPDEILDHLAERFIRSGINPEQYSFLTWAAMQAEQLGYQF
ncbi:hypothetical protein [Paenibacillus thiaminolyticus]|nr:hypothetical protein [Paenibacillus thiaminolyticus]WII39161.1 hypothetical protein O0V01_08770 [Paenibacillus thiaminolyticus]